MKNILSNIINSLKHPSNSNVNITFNNDQSEHVDFDLNTNLHMEYATALMLYGYEKAMPIHSAYAVFFERECHVTNPRALVKTLISDGYLEPSSLQDILYSYKVSELKSILESYGLKKNGKKDELVIRIMSEIPNNELNKYLPAEQYYSLSQKGREFLNTHLDYIELHRNAAWGISIEEYNSIKRAVGTDDFYDNMLVHYRGKLPNASSYEIRSHCFCLYQIYNHKNDYHNALLHILYVLYWDVNAKENYPSTEYFEYNSMSKNRFKSQYPVSVFAPGIMSDIVKLKDHYKKELVEQIYNSGTFRFSSNLCSMQTFIDILSDLYNSPVFPYDKWNDYLGKKYYKSIGW